MNALEELMKAAEQTAQEAESWADLSNALFNPFDGLVSRAHPTREAREAFVKTEEYRRIQQWVSDARDRFGLVEGATPKDTRWKGLWKGTAASPEEFSLSEAHEPTSPT